jgi:hypothetical protein
MFFGCLYVALSFRLKQYKRDQSPNTDEFASTP